MTMFFGKSAKQPAMSITEHEAQFAPDLHMAILAEPNKVGRTLLYFITITFLGSLYWSSCSYLDEISVAQGHVIPSSREQIIQSLEQGTLAEMLVQEGDTIEKGQILMRIDETRSDASYQEGRERWAALTAQTVRLHAEAFGEKLVFPDELASEPELIARETQAYLSRRRSLDESIAGLNRSLDLGQRELAITEPLVKKGLASELELIKLNRQLNDVRTQISDRKSRYETDANAELVKAGSELSQVTENLRGKKDSLTKMTIRAPVRGIVKNIRLTTIGGVIQSGQDLLEILPLDDQLLIEAFVKPSDVANLHPGLPAVVKLTAYDFGTYGGLTGIVELMSPDTVKDERAKGKSSNPVPLEDAFYRLLVRTTKSELHAKGQTFPVMPGMMANVEIRTGEKTVAEYIFRPIKRIKEALREK